MKTKQLTRAITLTLCFIFTLFLFPLCSFASQIPTLQIPDSVSTSDIIPQASEISTNPNYSEGFSSYNIFSNNLLGANNTVRGGCSITRLSSSSVNIAGYSICETSDPALKVSLTLQAYYDGAWHNLATKVKSIKGTRVDLSQAYNVTSGYYYRVSALHSLANGTSSLSRSNSIWIG